jgi:hypothetical protein
MGIIANWTAFTEPSITMPGEAVIISLAMAITLPILIPFVVFVLSATMIVGAGLCLLLWALVLTIVGSLALLLASMATINAACWLFNTVLGFKNISAPFSKPNGVAHVRKISCCKSGLPAVHQRSETPSRTVPPLKNTSLPPLPPGRKLAPSATCCAAAGNEEHNFDRVPFSCGVELGRDTAADVACILESTCSSALGLHEIAESGSELCDVMC